MGAKAGLEYDVRNVALEDEHWGPSPKVAGAINAMAAEGGRSPPAPTRAPNGRS
jgi:hypothetical protein